MAKTVLDHVIEWNKRKAKLAKDPRDKARYEENILNLEAFKETENGRPS